MSYQEIEVKILEVNRSEVEAKLLELGAKMSFDDEMTAWFFDKEDGEIRKRGDVLRLRKEGSEAVLAYKKHLSKGEAKVMEETETKVEDPEKMTQILLASGFVITKHTRKHRTEFSLPDAHVVFDDYHDELEAIPEFIEVEAKDMETLRQLVEALGFTMDQCLDWSTRELVGHYLGK